MQARVGEPEVSELGIHDSEPGVARNAALIHADEPSSGIVSLSIGCVLNSVAQNKVEEGHLQTTVIGVNLTSGTVGRPVDPLCPQLISLGRRQSDVNERLWGNENIGDCSESVDGGIGRDDKGNVSVLLVARSVEATLVDLAKTGRLALTEQASLLEIGAVQRRQKRHRPSVCHDVMALGVELD
jgi:hypothetical protein